MSEAARAAGIGPEIELRGKKYRLKERTPEWVGLMDTWLQGQAWDALDRMRGVWSPQVFNERADRLLAAITAGAYSWGSEAMGRAMQLPAGLKQGMYYALLAYDGEVTFEMVEEFWAASEAKAIEALARANPPDPHTAPAAGQDSA